MKKTFLFVLGIFCSLTMMAEPFSVRVNGKTDYPATNTGEEDFQGRVQYAAYDVSLKAGDKLTCYDGGAGAEWNIAVIDQYGAYQNFSTGSDALTCNKAGKYNIYIKLKYEDDMWYIEESTSGGGGGGSYSTSAPAKCPDVMFQCFYWDSYTDKGYGRTKWVDLNNGQATEIGKWFDLVWLPPMSKSTGGTGYLPTNYSSLDSQWGTKTNLVTLIKTLHQNGAKVVADIVINHVAGSTGWCTFSELNFGSYGKFQPETSWICSTDEMFSNPEAGDCRNKAKGAADDGYGSEANYEAGRDWDHCNAKVRDMCKAYLKWLRYDIGIDGFRYDYCKGFHNSHINDYNSAAKAYFSVMEMWDGNPDVLQQHLNDAGWNTMTFDFATKYTAFNDGIAANNYWKLKGAGLLGAGKARYAVTFLDSHDSFQRDNNEFCGAGNSMKYPGKIQQCYAYMLSMPGVPCVFYPHWVKFKDKIKPMINARYKTGVHSESAVSDEAGDGFYKATITGTNGEIRVLIGPNSGYDNTPSGYTLAVKGENYGVYYKTNSNRGDKDKERKPQGIDEVSAQQSTVKGEKFMENGQLFIRVGEKVYDMMGNIIK
ncbi:MAG: hypothetical protein IKX20_02380 [Paludibacteraceae bacterium]|nr:hypothetical protein [Paludibacteraceae bacterium]